MISILEILKRIYRRLKESDGSKITSLTAVLRSHWTIPEMLNRVNEVIQDIVTFTRCLWAATPLDALANTAEYGKPTTCDSVIDVYYNRKPLGKTSIDKLDHWERQGAFDSPWRDDTSTLPTCWCPGESSRNIRLVPKPQNDEAGAITVIHTLLLTPFDTASDPASLPFNGDQWLANFVRLIIWGVLADCYEEDNNLEMADYYQKKYDRGKLELKLKVNRERDPMPAFEIERGMSMIGRVPFWADE